MTERRNKLGMREQTNAEAIARLHALGVDPREDGLYHLWKVVTKDRRAPLMGGPVRYRDGQTTQAIRVNRDPSMECARGLHVLATPRVDYFRADMVLVNVLVHPRDVICVPNGTSMQPGCWYDEGPKLRVRRLTVEGEAQSLNGGKNKE